MELSDGVLPAILLVDFIVGDPVYTLHPIRLMGKMVKLLEGRLFSLGLGTRAGGILLVLGMLLVFVLPVWGVHEVLWIKIPLLGFVWDVYWGFHCLALRDLVVHVRRIAFAVGKNDLPGARVASSMLVGRDTEPMDGSACCRAGIESLSENLTDGVLSPLFWFAILGVPGMVFFKIASTLDSMVGYKTERYLYFGWAGARLDDLMNYIPARLTWFLTVFVALVLPGYSARKAWRVGLSQHSLAPGPNSGWSEAAFAGALQARIAGPIWKGGVLVTEVWLGEPEDRNALLPADMERAIRLAYGVTLSFAIPLSILDVLLI